jgi:hypothetical protein
VPTRPGFNSRCRNTILFGFFGVLEGGGVLVVVIVVMVEQGGLETFFLCGSPTFSSEMIIRYNTKGCVSVVCRDRVGVVCGAVDVMFRWW